MFSRMSFSAVIAVAATAAHGHPGGLNADGCHTNRKTGEYHCHRPQAAKPAERSLAPAETPREPARLYDAPAQADPPVSFGSCAAARAAGYRRMRPGQPGYSRRLDRDGDGIACE
jgi:hypothetical protein